MKHIFYAAAAFLIVCSFQSCSLSEISSSYPAIQEETPQVLYSETSVASSVSFVTEISESCPVSSQSLTETVTESVNSESVPPPDFDSTELSMLEAAGNPDYSAESEIPYVAWTEINLDKTMYAVSRCFGYELAIPEAKEKMIYDAGIELNVIARTSTGYYRIDGDLYILCSCLDNFPPEDADPSVATSCTVPAPPETTAVSAPVTR